MRRAASFSLQLQQPTMQAAQNLNKRNSKTVAAASFFWDVRKQCCSTQVRRLASATRTGSEEIASE
jgi:hypothetical protein